MPLTVLSHHITCESIIITIHHPPCLSSVYSCSIRCPPHHPDDRNLKQSKMAPWLRFVEVRYPIHPRYCCIANMQPGISRTSSEWEPLSTEARDTTPILMTVVQLLKSPLFHHGVRRVHKGVHRFRHGVPPEEMGGTKLDSLSPLIAP